MALTLPDALREARNIPCFCGTDDYWLPSFLRDMEMVLSLTDPTHHQVVQAIMLNKLRGKALNVIESLYEPSYDRVTNKLREEFGIKKSYIFLRNEAMDVKPANIKDLHLKLESILNQMNIKFKLEGGIELMYRPACNEKMVFDVYMAFLPCNIKSLLIQNKITSLSKAYSFYFEHNILDDITLVNKSKKIVEPANSSSNVYREQNKNTQSYATKNFNRHNSID